MHRLPLLLFPLTILRWFRTVSSPTKVKSCSCKCPLSPNFSFPQATSVRPERPTNTSSCRTLPTQQSLCHSASCRKQRTNPDSNSSRTLLQRILVKSSRAYVPSRIHLPWLHHTQRERWECCHFSSSVGHFSHSIRPRRPTLSEHNDTTSRF